VEKTSANLAEEGARYSEKVVSLSGLKRQPDAPEGHVFFDVVLTQHAAQVIDRSGAVLRTEEEKEGRSLVGVSWTQQGWRLIGVEVA
jgi:hypothetical protein